MYIVGKATHPTKQMAFLLWMTEGIAKEAQALLEHLRHTPRGTTTIAELHGYISPVQLWFTEHAGVVQAVNQKQAVIPSVVFEIIGKPTGASVFNRNTPDRYPSFTKAQVPTSLTVNGISLTDKDVSGGIILAAYIDEAVDGEDISTKVATAWIPLPVLLKAGGLIKSDTNILPLWVEGD